MNTLSQLRENRAPLIKAKPRQSPHELCRDVPSRNDLPPSWDVYQPGPNLWKQVHSAFRRAGRVALQKQEPRQWGESLMKMCGNETTKEAASTDRMAD
ncbi:hypothetical protein L596_014989 [Steinernema carpocapsae]|uniref:Uncharacterized protein n=1 Tax=Steinernema carpocapsae TaxID=34508 RepID=A0A4U5NEI0_STECR|nr:hypothetical protein L596_014989 [Steinernema carpocapsae]